MRDTNLRIVGFVGLTWLLAGAGNLGLVGCGGADGGTGTGGTTGAGTGGTTSSGSGGTTGAGAGGTTGVGTGGTTGAGAGGTTGSGGSGAGTGGATAAAGGRTGSGGATGTGGQGGRAGLTVTSTVLSNGATFPPANTCTGGANQSPPLSWTAGPAGTRSYAIVLIDTSITRYHWAIWNMATTVMSLPAALPAGASIASPVTALQAITGAGTPSYQGPCPNGNLHTYVFNVYALDVATLPGVATGAMAQNVFTAIQSHVLASGMLSGTSNASR